MQEAHAERDRALWHVVAPPISEHARVRQRPRALPDLDAVPLTKERRRRAKVGRVMDERDTALGEIKWARRRFTRPFLADEPVVRIEVAPERLPRESQLTQ